MILLRAAWVIPVCQPPLRDGVVQIDGERIADVRAFAGSDRQHPGFLDLGEAALLPGLINPHTHLELTGYAGQLSAGPFWDWISALTKLRGNASLMRARESEFVKRGACAALRGGTTCLGDISRLNLSWQALKPLPIRKVCFAELLSIAADPPRSAAELRAAVQEIDEDPLLTAGVSPHAPYTVHAEDYRAALELAVEIDRPWCTHWAETPEESAFLEDRAEDLPPVFARLRSAGMRSPRMSPRSYLGAVAPDSAGLLAHCNYVTAADADALAAAGHSVVFCPRAHRFFGHAPHPLMSLFSAGVRVCVGTDSLASNQSLAPLEELRAMRCAHGFDLPPQRLLRMITLDAAAALGLAMDVGSLSPGKQADLAAFPLPHGCHAPLDRLIDQCPAAAAVWVAGQPVALGALPA